MRERASKREYKYIVPLWEDTKQTKDLCSIALNLILYKITY